MRYLRFWNFVKRIVMNKLNNDMGIDEQPQLCHQTYLRYVSVSSSRVNVFGERTMFTLLSPWRRKAGNGGIWTTIICSCLTYWLFNEYISTGCLFLSTNEPSINNLSYCRNYNASLYFHIVIFGEEGTTDWKPAVTTYYLSMSKRPITNMTSLFPTIIFKKSLQYLWYLCPR